MAQVSIEQKPLYRVLPIGQQIIFTIAEPTIVATMFKVKFIAEVHASNTAINLSTTTDIIGTFKTTPNNAGVGIFDLRPILETFVKPDNEPYSKAPFVSEYKGSPALTQMFPVHLVDKYSLNSFPPTSGAPIVIYLPNSTSSEGLASCTIVILPENGAISIGGPYK